MSDPEKARIKPLEEADDYRLWRIRVEAACDSKGLSEALEEAENPHVNVEQVRKFCSDQKKASAIIIAALSNTTLRVVRSEVGNPCLMMAKLDERYDSKSAASRIAKMTELVSLRYESIDEDIGNHVDLMAGIIEQLEGMNTALPKELSIALLIASIHATELAPITAAIKTLSDEDATWDKVTSRLLEEHQSLQSKHRKERLSLVQKRHSECAICKAPGHSTDRCWLNPKNPKNRLNLPKSETGQRIPPRVHKPGREVYEKKEKKTKFRSALARVNTATAVNRNIIMLDSGTTSHMACSTTGMRNIQNCSISVALGDDSVILASQKGTLEVTWATSERNTQLALSDVLVSNQLAMNLLSVSALAAKGLCTLFLKIRAIIMDTEDDMAVVGEAFKREDGLFYIDGNEHESQHDDRANLAIVNSHMKMSQKAKCDRNDRRSPKRASEEQAYVDGEDDSFPTPQSSASTHIHGYTKGASSRKHADQVEIWHKRLGHVGSKDTITKLLQKGELNPIMSESVKCEPCEKGKFRRFFRGSLTRESGPGKIHADVVGQIDPASPEGFVYFLCIIDEYSRYAETIPLRSKGGASTELMKFMTRFERQTDVKLKAFHTDGGSEFLKARENFEELGLEVSTTTPYTAASNGLVERTQGVLLSHARTCLSQSNLPLKYWADALRHVTFARNAVPHARTGIAPYNLLYNKNPDYIKHLRPFGCKAFVAPNSPSVAKFSARLIEGIHLGHKKGGVYKIWTPTKIVFTKHVRMDESSFHGIKSIQRAHNGPQRRMAKKGGDGYSPDSDEEMSIPIVDPDSVTYIPAAEAHYESPQQKDSNEDSEANSSALCGPRKHNLRPRTAVAMPQFISTCDEPTLKEALSSDEAEHWKTAVQEEFNSLQNSGVFVNDHEPTSRPLPSGIILRLKRDSSGLPSKFKARLVARGNLQNVGETSYVERYAPVAYFELVRILTALSVEKKWATRHLDIKGAFLYASLPEHSKIWLKLPNIDGIRGANGQAVKLVKSLYGLRESPKLWYKTLSSCLLNIGFTQSSSNECVLFLNKNNRKVVLLA